MPKNSSYPYILEHGTSLSISDLRKWKYLRINHGRAGMIEWSKGGSSYSQVSIESDIRSEDYGCIDLKYSFNHKDYEERIYLESLASNLGAGVVWYFECPFTKKLCRNLYFNGGYFMSRLAMRNAMYDNQTKSHRERKHYRQLHKALLAEKLYPKLRAKHFKRYYDGMPTKRYLKLTQKIRESQRAVFPDLEKHFIKSINPSLD
jgi:hypothetical protein